MSKLVIFGDFAPNQLCLTYPKKGLLTSQRLVSGHFFAHSIIKNHKKIIKNRVLVFIERSTGFNQILKL